MTPPRWPNAPVEVRDYYCWFGEPREGRTMRGEMIYNADSPAQAAERFAEARWSTPGEHREITVMVGQIAAGERGQGVPYLVRATPQKMWRFNAVQKREAKVVPR